MQKALITGVTIAALGCALPMVFADERFPSPYEPMTVPGLAPMSVIMPGQTATSGSSAVSAYAYYSPPSYYVRGPRIIHVPQTESRSERRVEREAPQRQAPRRAVRDVTDQASRDPAPPKNLLEKRVTEPKPERRKPFAQSIVVPKPVLPKPVVQNAAAAKMAALPAPQSMPPVAQAVPAPKPVVPQRAILSAPPATPALHDGPTPLRPTPRFGMPPEAAPAPEALPSPEASPAPEASTAQLEAPVAQVSGKVSGKLPGDDDLPAPAPEPLAQDGPDGPQD